MPVLLAYAIEDSIDIFRISGGGFEHPNHPPRYATGVTDSFTSPNKTRKKRDITKLRSLGHSEMQNVESSTYAD